MNSCFVLMVFHWRNNKYFHDLLHYCFFFFEVIWFTTLCFWLLSNHQSWNALFNLYTCQKLSIVGNSNKLSLVHMKQNGVRSMTVLHQVQQKFLNHFCKYLENVLGCRHKEAKLHLYALGILMTCSSLQRAWWWFMHLFLCQCFVKQGHEEQLILACLTAHCVKHFFIVLVCFVFNLTKANNQKNVIKFDSKDIAAAPASGARSRNFWQYFIHVLLKNYQFGFLKFKCKLWSVHQISA